ncbi:MAG: hypothetical protein ACR2HD_00655, partial [Solirubrobacteraceae bacterium]
MHSKRRVGMVLAGMAVAGCLVAPAAASASSVGVVRTTQSADHPGIVITTTITYRPHPGESHRLSVSLVWSRGP